jgi:hypothetical protein
MYISRDVRGQIDSFLLDVSTTWLGAMPENIKAKKTWQYLGLSNASRTLERPKNNAT